MSYQATGWPPFINVGLSIAEWNAYVASYNFGTIPPSRVVLHHTWKPTVAQWRGVASMKGMQNYYRGLGWSAAPHIYTGPDKIWLATPMSEVGIHAGVGNSGTWNGKWSYSIGLEMVGNYDQQRPSGAVWEHAKAVMGALSKRLGIAPRNLIYFHRDFSTKSCPGWAVTKEWVWAEVEAWVNNETPPAPPPAGEIGTPTPDDELLMETILSESYSIRGEKYTSEWAFHQYAMKHNLGMPIGPSTRLKIGKKEYNYQPFARETLFCEIPNWGDVQLLSKVLGGSIPASGLGRALLEATYKAGGATFHADWASHQYAMSSKLGPPIGEGGKIRVGGAEYGYQVFAVDTLYFKIPHWSDIKLLHQLSGSSDSPDAKLRDALLAETYKRSGTEYHPEWAFHQFAHKLNNGSGIGTPLSKSFKTTVGGTTYALQVYALDTLYNVVPHWSDVRQLSELVGGQSAGAQGIAFSMPMVESSIEVEGTWEPPQAVSYSIVRYSPPSPSYSQRKGARVSMVIIHGDSGLASATLERMTSFGAHRSTHYYITIDGTIHQIVDEKDAAWHSGMATAGGLWLNLNSISIGVTLEDMPGQLGMETLSTPQDADDREHIQSNTQIKALHWLLCDLVQRYRLRPDDIILSGSLACSSETIPGALSLMDVFKR